METLTKQSTANNPVLKIIAAILFIILPVIGFTLGIQYQRIAFNDTNNSLPNRYSVVVTPTQINQADLCNLVIKLPQGYHYQEPINPFYGNYSIREKRGHGLTCKVILGPHFKETHEGFIGENIQINVYSPDSLKIKELINNNSESNKYLPLHTYRFTRPSYGGQDEVIVFENNFKIYEVLWRNDPNDLEHIIKQIINQL